MRKFLLFLFLLSTCVFAKAQYAENFNDGDFTSNPTWSGDAALFKVNTAFQLQTNGTADGTAVLSVPIVVTPEMEWSCWVKLAFAPSDNNLARIYLSSDQADLKGPLNGYYVKLGEGGSLDAIELVKQTGNIHTVICRGTDGFVAASFAIKIKVVRTNVGVWKVYADQAGGINYQLQASGVDNTFSSGNYTGVYCKYTSSNATKFYFDDFYAGPIVVDKTPPTVLSVNVADAGRLVVQFSEAVTKESANLTGNYTVTPGSVQPSSTIYNTATPSVVTLVFTPALQPDVAYKLQVQNAQDLAGNMMQPVSMDFSWHQAKMFDVLINEIMADPSPPVNLPNVEYIELFNRSNFAIDLKNWSAVINGTAKPLPEFTLSPGAFVLLCDDASKLLLEPFGKVIDFSSFAITNTEGVITLQTPDGLVIHSVAYSDNWYKSNFKKDGGWSLEMIDPLNPCGEASNWTASTDNSGGTPGKVNSVNASNPDTRAPAIARVGVSDANHITVWFSEQCDSTFIGSKASYTIDKNIGIPSSVWVMRPDFMVALLTLATPLTAGELYTLTCSSNITDCAGNKFQSAKTASFAIPSEAQPLDIVINELLYDPTATGVDFVELFNRSSKVLDLKDLVLANYDTLNHVITKYCEISAQSMLLLPGSYMVLTPDSAAVKKCYKTENPDNFVNMGYFPEMSNTEGLVSLNKKGGEVIDLVAYNASMQYPVLTSVDGVSLERISPERASGDKTNWHSASATVGYATPAYKNSQFGVPVAGDGEITLSPAIFSPDNDGYNDVLSIAYTFSEPGNSITIRVFDAGGRLVRTLVNNVLCGTSGTFSWDGITNDNLKAQIGRYVVLAEIYNLDGTVKHFKKTAVLGGKL